MPADIRSFFAAKGGSAPAKPALKTENEPPKKGRAKGRKVVEDSDEDDAPVASTKKATTKATPKKKKTEPEPVAGVSISASDYFASSKKGPNKPEPKKQLEVRSSPRTTKQTAPPPAATGVKNGVKNGAKKSVTAYKKNDFDDDDDAYMDDDDDGGDDIFAADIKGRKRTKDDYVDDDEDQEILPEPKRVASRGRPKKAPVDSDDDVMEVDPPTTKAAPKSRKRKSPSPDEEDSEEDVKPKKKAAPAKPRAPPKAKSKKDDPEDANIQAILDDIPTVRPPTPPQKDPDAKFDWRKAGAGGGNSGPPPNAGGADIPVGEPNCLAGQTFVFTGLLKTIAREEAQALVKRYGGKVTTAPSSKTKWVVLGDDAGPSKLKKIHDLGLKTIDENGLFKLISSLPAGGGDGKEAEKVRQKQKAEEDKIKADAKQMEAEEKKRQAEAEKARKAAAARGAASSAPPPQPSAQLWTTKYAPTQLSHICGNKGNVEKIANWLQNWAKSKKYDFQKRGADGMGGVRAILISGPPGIGKTTAAHLAANLAGYDVIESNASDTRSKKLVGGGVGDAINNTSLLGFFAGDGKKVDNTKKNTVLIMDEVDGMSAGDRGGIVALAKFCKKTEVPLILICNDRRLPKMKPFDHVVMDVKFIRPTVDQIRSRIMTICHREGLKLPPQVIDQLIMGTKQDIRQIINMVATAKLDQKSMNYDDSQSMSKAWEKHIVLKPWDICQKMLGGGLFAPASKSTLNDKIELYFNDHEFSYLMIQENYLSTRPMALNGKGYNRREENLKYLELVDNAAQSISDGDLIDRMIHGPQQHWSLMPTHAVFSTVRPASYIAGSMSGGGTTFTSWLGNNSKAGKFGRANREIHAHMRLKSSGDHNEVRQQYLPVLWQQLIKRLEIEGRDAIDEVIELMDSYYLTRDDFDLIKELGVGPQAEDRVNIETQTKAHFTRTYNSMSHPVPFMKASSIQQPKNLKIAKEAPDLEEAIEEEDEGDVAEPAAADDEEELDLKKDKYIKQAKAKPKAAPKKKGKAKAAVDDDDDDAAPVTKGRGRSKGAGAKGKKK